MKVAIIGAGTSGLSCAIELERNGISPVIFERNSFIGEHQPHVSAFLSLLTRPVWDPVKYMDKVLGIRLAPLNKLKRVEHYSPNNEMFASGPLGYLMVRGNENDSVKNQLYGQVKANVQFNSFVRPEDIEHEFDFVVVADGTWTTPQRYGIWQEIMRAWVKGGIFAGEFEKHTIKMWLDNDLTNGVYIYCAPYSKSKAVIAHVVQNIEHEELNEYWHRFLRSRSILKDHDMLESWELPHHTGTVTTNRVGKVYFVGTAGGGVEPFLGFGQFNAVVSGVMAARSIAHGCDINLLLRDLRKKGQELNTLRALMNKAENRDFDRLLSITKIPGLRSTIYRTDIDVLKLFSGGSRLIQGKKKQQDPASKGGN